MKYLTTPIYYPNDRPHIGTAYTTLVTDAVARYWRLVGEEVFAVTGVDEYGLKIARAAADRGLTPQEWVDSIVGTFQDAWTLLDLDYDDFIRTTEERHKATVQSVLQRMYDNGDVYLGHYEGPYCVACEAYYADDELVDGSCPVHARPVEIHAEDNWFFRWSRYTEPLLAHIEAHPEFIVPVERRNEVVGFLTQGAADISMSRASLDWGIPLPWDESQVAYVWFDALINYVSAAGFSDDPERFARQWPASVHVVGKDILRFHAALWPAMLMSAGLELPEQIAAHGWLLVGGTKMSKSNATQIFPEELVETFGVDGYRYHFLRDVSFGPDGNFSWEGMVELYNSDLANDFGNLVSRSTAMLSKYFDGRLPAPGAATELDRTLQERCAAVISQVDAQMTEMAFNRALQSIWEVVGAANKYIDDTTPWALAKDPGQQERLGTVMYNLLETVRLLGLLVSPFMPDTGTRIRTLLGLDPAQALITGQDGWGGLQPGTQIAKAEPLFPRIEAE
jgi:methionyl-tRNA synthetase